MYQIQEGNVKRNEYSPIAYTWFRNEDPNANICIMLPGLGYTTQRPLFHYATGLCLEQNIDVLHVNYTYSKNDQFQKLPESEQSRWMYEDMKATVEEVLITDTHYERCFFISKSIGTISMAIEWTKRNFIRTSFGIWLTPLLKQDLVYEALLHSELPSLCVIGDQDHHYLKERVKMLKKNQLISTVTVPNGDHSLEIKGDIAASIDSLKMVMKCVQEFIVEKNLRSER
jgi:hypothetical protein